MPYDCDIREIPLGIDSCRRKVETFLMHNGLHLERVDTFVGIFDADEVLVAGGGLDGDTIKCVAVSESLRGSGLLNSLVSRLQSIAFQRGYATTMVFTKPENENIFRDLGYVLLGKATDAVLLESSGLRLEKYKKEWGKAMQDKGRLLSLEPEKASSGSVPKHGVCIVNANPFTKGHQYLIETAARQVHVLAVVVVSQDSSEFSTEERMEMVRLGTRHIPNVVVLSSGPYAISAITFPSYFLKDFSAAAENQMQLDADLFCRHIAPALRASVRFVGTEPYDALTDRYNAVLRNVLDNHGLQLVEIPRFGNISASKVRHGSWRDAACTSLSFVLSHYACIALQAELDLTPKPGLVDKNDSGAHVDMDYETMQLSIATLRPYFKNIAETVLKSTDATEQKIINLIHEVGMEAEKAMLQATGGINTHGGALFSFGLTLAAFCRLVVVGSIEANSGTGEMKSRLQSEISRLAELYPAPRNTHGSIVKSRYPSVCGALANALTGFSVAMEAGEASPFCGSYQCQMSVFLKIMSLLDDTNILFRSDIETLTEVKNTASRLLREGFSEKEIAELNVEFTKRNISPGGVADMYALSIFISLLCSAETEQ